MKTRAVIVVIVAILAVGAVASWLLFREDDRYTRADIDAERARQAGLTQEARVYFPDRAFAESEEPHLFAARWYTSFLMSMDEGPLFRSPAESQRGVYRFTWLRTFHRPVVCRVDVLSDQEATFTIKVSDGSGGYIPGKVIRNEHRRLDPSRIQEVRRLFQESRFFSLPHFVESDAAGADGAEWIIEAVVGGQYHIASRWSPTDGEVGTIGMKFIHWAGGRDLSEVY